MLASSVRHARRATVAQLLGGGSSASSDGTRRQLGLAGQQQDMIPGSLADQFLVKILDSTAIKPPSAAKQVRGPDEGTGEASKAAGKEEPRTATGPGPTTTAASGSTRSTQGSGGVDPGRPPHPPGPRSEGPSAHNAVLPVLDACHATLSGHMVGVTACGWHPIHDSLLVTGDRRGTMMFWYPLVFSRPVAGLRHAHDGCVECMAWHPMGHLLATGGTDHLTKFWSRSAPGDLCRDRYHVGMPRFGGQPAEDRRFLVFGDGPRVSSGRTDSHVDTYLYEDPCPPDARGIEEDFSFVTAAPCTAMGPSFIPPALAPDDPEGGVQPGRWAAQETEPLPQHGSDTASPTPVPPGFTRGTSLRFPSGQSIWRPGRF